MRTVYGVATTKHIKPMHISSTINQQIRDEKRGEGELWEELLAKARYEMPAASDQKLRALVYK
jgi:hypothetical protein